MRSAARCPRFLLELDAGMHVRSGMTKNGKTITPTVAARDDTVLSTAAPDHDAGPSAKRLAIQACRVARTLLACALIPTTVIASAVTGTGATAAEGGLRASQERFEWQALRQAAEAGDPDAQCLLGELYAAASVLPQDYGKAVEWFRRAAAQGLAEGEFALGLMYRHGRGVRQDEAEAARWYRRAAEQGHGAARVNLGLLYEAGLGVRQDYLEAARWYQKALECGSAPSRDAAAVHLGVLYAEGLGVERDDAAAVEWFKQAAAAGEPSGQFNLALMYRYGRGTAKNDVKAYKWLLLSLALTPGDARWTIAAALLELGEAMSPDAIAEARRQAREWAAAFDSRHKQPD